MTSKSTSDAYSSSGRQGRAFPSSTSVALACTAAAAAAEPAAWSPDENLDTSVLHISSVPGDRGSARRLRAATLTLPAWRHADDARSSFASSEASWAASLGLEFPTLVNAISHGSRSTMSPLSTNANLCRLLMRPSGEWSRAGMRYHNLIARRSEFGVTESRFGRCSSIAWLSCLLYTSPSPRD